MALTDSVVPARSVRLFPRVTEETGAVTPSMLWYGTPGITTQTITWHAQELTLDDEKAPVWRPVGEASTRDALLSALKGKGFTTENTVFTFSIGVPE